jgi:hypothetical protein
MIVTSQELRALEREAEALIEEASAYVRIEELLTLEDLRRGRPRDLSVKALFVALQLLSFSGTYFLKEVPKALNGLSPDARRRLGLLRKNGRPVTLRQVHYLMNRIDHALRHDLAKTDLSEEARYGEFDAVFSAIATVGAHPGANGSLSISIDGSDIPTWGNDRNVHRRLLDEATGELTWAIVRRNTDTDAGWRGAKNTFNKPPMFGYVVTAAVSVRDDGGPDVPRATVAARFRPVNADGRKAALACVEEIANKRGQLGDVLVDREYTQSKHGKDFLEPVRELGGEPVFDLKENQVGPSGTVLGAIIIDGQPFSPSIPKALRTIAPPRGKGSTTYKPSPQALADYQQSIKARSIYALVPHGQRLANGNLVFQCPGAAGKLLCPLQAPFGNRRTGLLPAANPPKTVVAGTVCASRYRTFTSSELPLYQRHLYGSKEWSDSYSRRGSSIEPHFGGLKGDAGAALRHGKVRVTGIIKTGLMVAFGLATTNRNLARAFDARRPSDSPPKVRRGRPYTHRLTRHTLGEADKTKVLYVART